MAVHQHTPRRLSLSTYETWHKRTAHKKLRRHVSGYGLLAPLCCLLALRTRCGTAARPRRSLAPAPSGTARAHLTRGSIPRASRRRRTPLPTRTRRPSRLTPAAVAASPPRPRARRPLAPPPTTRLPWPPPADGSAAPSSRRVVLPSTTRRAPSGGSRDWIRVLLLGGRRPVWFEGRRERSMG
jgi:hypothetical protein